MPNIIEQLEKGKELLESGKIDVKQLKTKVSSDDENIKNNDGNNNNNIDTSNGCNISDDVNDTSNTVNNNSVSNDDSIDNNCNDRSSDKKSLEENNEKKVEKYPGFDFSQKYTKGQTIFYVKVNEIIGEKELMELKIRTIYPKMMVCCTEKSYAQCIGPDSADFIFLSRYEAVDCYNNTAVQAKIFENYTAED